MGLCAVARWVWLKPDGGDEEDSPCSRTVFPLPAKGSGNAPPVLCVRPIFEVMNWETNYESSSNVGHRWGAGPGYRNERWRLSRENKRGHAGWLLLW